jgi:His-Xaa-Ser system radical SAM maturase HxsB/His-Xaa-Ser system protein HxsD
MEKSLIEKIEENKFLIKIPKRLYSKEAVFSAAHKLLDNFFVLIDNIDESYVGVYIQPKHGIDLKEEDIKKTLLQFNNELIDQQLRIDLEKHYGKIRDLIVEQAFKPVSLYDLSSKIKKNLNEITSEEEKPYYYLPFRFQRFPESTMLLVNEVGEYLFLNTHEFEKLINYQLSEKDKIYYDLKAKHFIYDSMEKIPFIVDVLATKYRTKKAFLNDSISLHMVVITLRCNHKCRYCHASSKDPSMKEYDMNLSTARRVTEMIFQSPSPVIKIEFQGGEPLLNFQAVQEIVEYAEQLNKKMNKYLSFVLCTNLTLINEDILDFCKKHQIYISTSFDGPESLHNMNRIMRDGRNSFKLFIEKLELTKNILGNNKVSALLTLTKQALPKIKEIIDEYIKFDFEGIFFRTLNPYGYARESSKYIGYSIEEFIQAYKEGISYILELNKKGKKFIEFFALLILRKILTPFCTGFMDLQSPTGAGTMGAVYHFNGDVFPSDEARMLATTGDPHFKLGNVFKNTYSEIFGNSILRKMVRNSCLEIIPGCHGCAYIPYCGADPVRAYSIQKDKEYIGYIPGSDFCKKNKEIISFLFNLLRKGDEEIYDIFWSWINNKSLKEIKI